MTTDDDLFAVRELARTRTGTTPEELARLRARVVRDARAGTPARRIPWRLPRWVVPLAAAVVALAVVGGVGVVLRTGSGGTPVGLPPATAEIFAELERVAAGATAVTAGPGDLLHVHDDMLVPAEPDRDHLVAQVRDLWYEPEGMVPVRQEIDGHPTDMSQQTRLKRLLFARTGVGWFFPSPAWLAGLPADPGALRTQIMVKFNIPTASVSPAASPELADTAADLWTACTELMLRVDPLLPAPVRVALLRLLATADDVTATEVTIDGRRLYSLRQGSGPGGVELLLDPATARVAGHLQDYLGGTHASPSPYLYNPSAIPTSGLLRQRWLTTYEVVPA